MDTHEFLLIGIASIIVLGVAGQWIAARLRVPAILALLTLGLLVGPVPQWVTGRKFIDPDVLLGNLVQPIVALSVAVILFEGGLTLNVAELRHVGRVLRNLVTVGMLITWLVAAVAARFVLTLNWPLAVLLGAVLVVTGPTVIGPMIRYLRPVGRVGPILRWEGIVIDPIGALLALLVFESIHHLQLPHVAAVVAMNVGKTILFGGLIGAGASALLVLLLRRFWVADELENPVTLGLVIAAFAASNYLQSESGLLAVTVMGVILANQKLVSVSHILRFKESLTILLVSSLFILLASRLDAKQLLDAASVRTATFIAILIFVARPLSVFASTIGGGLSRRDRLFLAFLAPRGIVAAAVSSVFALRLRHAGIEGADQIVPVTFAVIISTVVVYGLASPRLARRLKLVPEGAGGFVIAGANPVARAIATEIKRLGQEVLIVDTNHANAAAARMAGVPALTMSVLSEAALERIDGAGIGQLLALTPNEEVNTLAALHLGRVFGRSRVYQLATEQEQREHGKRRVSNELSGRTLFAPGVTYEVLADRVHRGAQVKHTSFTDEFSYEMFRTRNDGDDVLPMFLIDEAGVWQVITAEEPATPKAGQSLVSLISPSASS